METLFQTMHCRCPSATGPGQPHLVGCTMYKRPKESILSAADLEMWHTAVDQALTDKQAALAATLAKVGKYDVLSPAPKPTCCHNQISNFC